MRGKIVELSLYDEKRCKHGFIIGKDDQRYYFNEASMLKNVSISSFFVNDEVSFSVEKTSSNYDRAVHVKLEKHEVLSDKPELMTPGISDRLDLDRAAEEQLKPESGEYEIIKKLSQVFRITRVGHHYMDQTSQYQFCLAGVTDILKQFVRESGEFLIVFSHFDNKMWLQKTLKVERELRKRRELVERRPLVNFYILISNATELYAKINSIKGEPHAAVIPFTFDEILNCTSKSNLSKLILTRFGEYYFENNMLGENDAIDDDNLLFGDRGKIADAVVSRCHSRNNSGIFGLRRSGKTSVLNAVLRRLDWEDTPYVLIESRTYETFSSWKNVLFEISCLVRARTLNIQRDAEETLSAFHARLKLSSTEEDYEKRGVACFIDDIQRYCQDQLFIIALDEIELITYNSATSETWKSLEAYKGFWSALRGCGCPLVVCGVNSTINEVSNLSFNNEQCDNPMYGRISNCSDCADTYLPAFSDQQTKEMINTLGGYSNIAFSNIYSQINSAFGGQPWAIRQFCSYVFEQVKSQRNVSYRYEVSKATYTNLLRKFQSSSLGVRLCETILQHLRIYYPEYTLLNKLALTPDKYCNISSNDCATIDHLQKYGLIEYDQDTGYVSFRIDIIKDHIKISQTKSPEDMDNTERRRYVQDCVATCEKKLKQYILNYYTYASTPDIGRQIFFKNGSCILKPHKGIIENQCTFVDFFDHKKFNFYFSTLGRIISSNWNVLGARFEAQGITNSRFQICMEDLNAGRNDADHYDPENTPTPPDNWEIDDHTIQSFRLAYETFKNFFASCGL